MSGPGLDPTFTALPYRQLGDAALARAQSLGVAHADFRFERVRYQQLGVRDGVLQGASDREDMGMAVRVIHRGAWGFASGVALTTEEAVRLAETAVAVALVAAEMTSAPVELAPEPVHDDVAWVSSYDVNPLEVPVADKAALLIGWTNRLRAAEAVEHASASLQQVQENKYYADLAGTRTTQQRIRLQPEFEAMGSGADTFDSMRSIAPPVGRGWEYLTDGSYDWDAELEEVPAAARREARRAQRRAGHLRPGDPPVQPLADHPRVDRARHRAGPGPGLRGQLRRHVVRHDRPPEHPAVRLADHARHRRPDDRARARHRRFRRRGRGRPRPGTSSATVSSSATSWTGRWATMHPELNDGRSNGCAYADSPGHIPIQRMANVSLQPAADGPSTAELIGRVERGLYVVGDKSWSIDMQRFNFQFTGQRFYRIEDGELVGQVRDAAYQATTTEFWNSMEAVGGPETWELGGAFNCGKAQPGQVASVSHGCPTSLFRDVRILNTNDEAGH